MNRAKALTLTFSILFFTKKEKLKKFISFQLKFLQCTIQLNA